MWHALGSRSTGDHGSEGPGRTRLEGWKEIAAYFGRSVRTIQRWERDEQLPIRRHLHGTAATVYGYTNEFARWRALRDQSVNSRFDDCDDEAESVDVPPKDAPALVAMSRHHWAQRSKDDLHKSIALARAALQRDPNYAPAHAVLALAHATRASYGFDPPHHDIKLARESATVAIQLDATITEAYQALGFVHLLYEWDWSRAAVAFHQALRLNPTEPTTHQLCSLWHLAMGANEQALSSAAQAESLAPESNILAAHSAWILHLTGRYADAITKAASLVRRKPHFWRGYFNLALSLAIVGRAREAVQAMEVAAALNDSPTHLTVLVHALARCGNTDRARAVLASLEANGQYVSPYWHAYAVLGLGDDSAARLYLQQAVANREWFVICLKHDPAFHSLATDAEFVRLCELIGLP